MHGEDRLHLPLSCLSSFASPSPSKTSVPASLPSHPMTGLVVSCVSFHLHNDIKLHSVRYTQIPKICICVCACVCVYTCVCVCVCAYVTQIWMPIEVMQRSHIPWSWSYGQLCTPWCRCWELNLDPLSPFLQTQNSLGKKKIEDTNSQVEIPVSMLTVY